MYKKNLKKDAIDLRIIYYLSCFIHDVVFSFTMIDCESLGHMIRCPLDVEVRVKSVLTDVVWMMYY